MGPTVTSVFSSRRIQRKDVYDFEGFDPVETSIQKRHYESPRFLQLVWPDRHDGETLNVNHQENNKEHSPTTPRREVQTPIINQDGLDCNYTQASTPFYSWSSPTRYRGHHRRIKGRLENKISTTPVFRKFRSLNNVHGHSGERTSGNFLGYSNIGQSRSIIADSYGQSNQSACYQERRFQGSPSQSIVSLDLASSLKETYFSEGYTHQRTIQCQSRPVVQKYCDLNRVESQPGGLSSNY